MSRFGYDLEDPETYDSLVPLAIPHWEAYYRSAAGLIPPGARRVLELASGTGILTTMIRERIFGCEIVCIDKNPDMLAVARRKKDLQDVAFIEGDILDDWPEGPFDAVVTMQCIFSLSAGKRASVAQKAYQSLSDGGIFIDGDMFYPESGWEFSFYYERLKDFMCRNNLSEEEASAMLDPLERMIRDHQAADFCSILRRAGFTRCAIPYQNELYGIAIGIRDAAGR